MQCAAVSPLYSRGHDILRAELREGEQGDYASLAFMKRGQSELFSRIPPRAPLYPHSFPRTTVNTTTAAAITASAAATADAGEPMNCLEVA